MPTPARNLAASLLLLVAGLAVALLLAEVALRSIGFAHPKLYVADEHTGSFFRPGVQFTYTNEGRGRVTINSAALRDREHELGKPPGVFRIAVLGDSFAAALEVDRE